jgi:hypothetical protein
MYEVFLEPAAQILLIFQLGTGAGSTTPLPSHVHTTGPLHGALSSSPVCESEVQHAYWESSAARDTADR